MTNLEKILAIENETRKIIALGQHLWQKSKGDKDFESLNEEEKTVLYIEMVESEVNNGGFKQYFLNYSGEYAYESVAALKRINANKAAELLEEAIKIFPVLPVQKNTENRRIEMENLNVNVSDKWNELDNKFFLYPDNLEKLVIDFVVRNKHKFE